MIPGLDNLGPRRAEAGGDRREKVGMMGTEQGGTPGTPHGPGPGADREQPEASRVVPIAEAFECNYPILDPLGGRLHYPGEAQYEAWREEVGAMLAGLFGIFRRDPWGDVAKPWWMAGSTLDPPARPEEVARMAELYRDAPMFFAEFVEQGRYDDFVRWLRGQ
jgi:hypothetical protein